MIRPAYIVFALGAALVVLLLVFPYLTGSTYQLRVFMLFLIYGILALGLNILVGLTGLISLGQAGLYAVGAYTVAILATTYGIGLLPALLVAILVTAALGAVLAYPTVRVRGVYLAVLTIAFGLIVQNALIEWSNLTGGALGISGIPRADIFGIELSNQAYYYVLVVAFLVAFIFHHNIIRSRYGRAMLAANQSDVAAQSLGINTTMTRTMAFMIAASFAGAAGAFYVYLNRYISPDVFTFAESIKFLLMVVLGGSGTTFGPIVGAAILNYLPEYFQAFDVWQNFVYGALLLFTMFVMQRGIVGTIEDVGARLLRLDQTDKSLHGSEEGRRLLDGILGKRTTSSSAPCLAIDGLTVRFGGLTAVNEVTEIVERGRIHALIGPNGAGKSTLLNVASGFYAASEGEVRLFGEDVTALKSHQLSRRGVARTFQNTELFGEMTVLDNILVGLHTKATATFFETVLRLPRHYRDERRFQEIARALLDYVGIGDYAHMQAKNLAFGHQRRLEIARALATDPSLLLLDEPAAGLTQAEIAELVALIRDLNTRGVTVMLVEHHVELIMEISEKVTVLDYGRVIASGPAQAVRSDPKVIEAYFGHPLELKVADQEPPQPKHQGGQA